MDSENEAIVNSYKAQLAAANERIASLDGDLAETKSENERLKIQLTAGNSVAKS
jgi:hypothetical protein